LASSCTTTKKTTETSSKTKKSVLTETKTDSTNVIKKNQKIDNEYTIPLRTADSLTNARIREALRNFQAGARSGNNSTNVVFDEDALAFKIASIVGETTSEKTTTNTDTNTEKSFEQKTDEYIEKKIKRIPWWFYALIGFWFLPQIIERLQFIINPLSAIIKKKS